MTKYESFNTGPERPPAVPLGYDTAEFSNFAAQICGDAISGRYKGAVIEKITEIEKSLSMARKPRLILSDPTSVYLLSLAGRAGLDQLFIPKAPVWITDGVRYELLRGAGNGSFGAQRQRETLRAWFEDNEDRIHIEPTDEFEEYRDEVRRWTDAGQPAENRPSWGKCSEIALKQTFPILLNITKTADDMVFLSDEIEARSLIYSAAEGQNPLTTHVTGTIGFLKLAENFGGQNSQAIWKMIQSKT